MPNVIGKVGTLTVLAPILPEREQALADALRNLSFGDDSPFHRLAQTHFARFVIIDRLVHETADEKQDRLKSHYLLFAAIFDGDPNHYLESLCTRMLPEVDEIWSHCIGYPGAQDHTAFKVYFEHNRLDAALFFPAYKDATLSEVQESLAFRRKLIDFAVRTQGMEADQLYDAYRKTLVEE